ncbi:MAG: DUF2199 domain-containing protein [Bradyrhizobiaceae bacterium]|nr:DUF2199 domain-containing protein [Bradyrhizobiaceae bacterium]
MGFEFRCRTCGEIHVGTPGFAAAAPLTYYAIAETERPTRCKLCSDDCIIDDKWFFVRGCLEIPVHGADEPMIWGVWADVSEQSFLAWQKVSDQKRRSHVGPFLGWLNASLKSYPETLNLKTKVHLRDNGLRPWLELEPTDHPLAVEQRSGISIDRVAEIYSTMMHGTDH